MENTAEKLYEEIINLNELSYIDIEKAKEIFRQYQYKKIIKSGMFEDEIWQTTDEYSNVGLHFNFNQFSYLKYYYPKLNMSFEKFIEFVKVFIIYSMGKCILHTLQNVLNDLKKMIKTDPEEIYAINPSLKINYANYLIDFFTIIPNQNDSDFINNITDALDEYLVIRYSNNINSQRKLVSFDGYFLFNDILNDYWKGSISIENRLFYYPLYLFWQITAIIPLRPREFILTPRNCLVKKDDGYYLRLRRNKIKGNDRRISYKIEDDYTITTYKIPDNLAEKIQKYIDFTNKFEHTELETLFVTDMHFKHWGQKKHSNSRYFTYVNLNTLMQYFYKDIICGEYKLNVVYDKAPVKNEINYIHLGDTRHIALINIIAEGNSVVTAMLLAGHDDVNTSAHYYSNISNLIECKTYRQYRHILEGKVKYQISKYKPLHNISEHINLDDGGKCFSNEFMQGSISDCMNSSGPSGEIGYCPNCKYYRKKYQSFYSADKKYLKSIDEKAKEVTEMVKLYRKGKGDIEDIGTALLKLKSSANTYQEYYEEKIARMEMNGEDIWEERN